MKVPVVISLYDRTGIMVNPWAEVGCECICVDIQHSIRQKQVKKMGNGKVWYVWGDCRTWMPPLGFIQRAIVLFAFPPCTHVTVSGARDFNTKGTAMLRDSLEMFSAAEHAARWSGLPFMIENPIGKFSDHIRPPNYIFQPWQYGDLWTKATCLWIGNGFYPPRALYHSPPKGTTHKIHLLGGSANKKKAIEKQNVKSETPPNFARAVFEANKMLIK